MGTKRRSALIVVDVQQDFCEGGALAVAGGNAVAERIAEILESEKHTWDEVVFTKDWHLPQSSNGGHIALPPEEPDYIDTWPAHCIANTDGAKLHPALEKWDAGPITDRKQALCSPTFFKGYGAPAYSGFEGTLLPYSAWAPAPLSEWLTEQWVTSLSVVGLTADYCVEATALDGLQSRFHVDVIPELTAGIHRDGETVRKSLETFWEW